MDKWTLGHVRKNKANSKPIQSQNKANSKPIQTQTKPIWRQKNAASYENYEKRAFRRFCLPALFGKYKKLVLFTRIW
jgi:hypothetical protein